MSWSPNADTGQFQFGAKGGRQPFVARVNQPGQFNAIATWTGAATSLTLRLQGPGKKEPYAVANGPSPLALNYEFTAADASNRADWILWVEANGECKGKIEYTTGGFRGNPLGSISETSKTATSKLGNYGFTLKVPQFAVFDPLDESVGDTMLPVISANDSDHAKWAYQLGDPQSKLRANSFVPLHSRDQAAFGPEGVPINPEKVIETQICLLRTSDGVSSPLSEEVTQAAAQYAALKLPDDVLGSGYAPSHSVDFDLDKASAALKKMKPDKKPLAFSFAFSRDDLMALTQGDGTFLEWLLSRGEAGNGSFEYGVQLRFDRHPGPIGPDGDTDQIRSLKVQLYLGKDSDAGVTSPVTLGFGADKKLQFVLDPGRRGFSPGEVRTFVLLRDGKKNAEVWPFGAKLGNLSLKDLKSLGLSISLENAFLELKGLKIWADGRPVYANLDIGFLFEPGKSNWMASDFTPPGN